jgi:hypothetical protein
VNVNDDGADVTEALAPDTAVATEPPESAVLPAASRSCRSGGAGAGSHSSTPTPSSSSMSPINRVACPSSLSLPSPPPSVSTSPSRCLNAAAAASPAAIGPSRTAPLRPVLPLPRWPSRAARCRMANAALARTAHSCSTTAALTCASHTSVQGRLRVCAGSGDGGMTCKRVLGQLCSVRPSTGRGVCECVCVVGMHPATSSMG